MKKMSLTLLTVTTLVLAGLLTIGLIGRNSVSVIAAQVTLPNRAIVGLGLNNTLSVFRPGSTSFTSFGQVSVPNGDTIIGIDFRLQGGGLYAVGAKGGVYRIVNSNGLKAVQVSTLPIRFNGGAKALVDFNPVANAIRLIGRNDQNIAVASTNGRDLNTAAVQTTLSYIPGDPSFRKDPNITDGAYTNVVAGAKNTIFYMVDSGTDKLVTIAPPLTATLSSNTGGGRLQTIGSVLDSSGRAMSFSPTTAMDIATDARGNDKIIILTDGTIATIDVNTIPPVLAAGVTQNIRASTVKIRDPNVVDIAVALR